MLLYHGSNVEIIDIYLERCMPYKDFGRGFYLTSIKEQAILMAKRTCRIFSGVPYVTAFEFTDDVLRENFLSVRIFQVPDAEWAIFVLNNRNRDFSDYADYNCNHDNKYDIVMGAVADDDIALLFRMFSNQLIDLNTLTSGMKYKKLNDQYSFHTEKAISFLRRTGVETYE